MIISDVSCSKSPEILRLSMKFSGKNVGSLVIHPLTDVGCLLVFNRALQVRVS